MLNIWIEIKITIIDSSASPVHCFIWLLYVLRRGCICLIHSFNEYLVLHHIQTNVTKSKLIISEIYKEFSASGQVSNYKSDFLINSFKFTLSPLSFHIIEN